VSAASPRRRLVAATLRVGCRNRRPDRIGDPQTQKNPRFTASLAMRLSARALASFKTNPNEVRVLKLAHYMMRWFQNVLKSRANQLPMKMMGVLALSDMRAKAPMPVAASAFLFIDKQMVTWYYNLCRETRRIVYETTSACESYCYCHYDRGAYEYIGGFVDPRG
jgi:hypothetical protein